MLNKKTFRYLKYLIIIIALTLPVFVPGLAAAAGNAVVSVMAPVDALDPGEQFTVSINVEPNNAIAGMQFNLSYDPAVVTINGITEGNLLDQGGANTYFSGGQINNAAGTVTGVFGAIINPGQSVATTGTFAVITMTAGSAGGSSQLTLSNVIIGDIASQPLPVSVINDTIDVADESPNPPPSGGGIPGGGGGGGGASGGMAGITNLRGRISADGFMLEDVIAADANSNVELWLSEGTFARNKYGQALTSLTIAPEEEVQSPAQGSAIIGQSYQIEPDGATFGDSVTLVFSYSPSEIPGGVPVDNFYIALWEPDTMTWTDLGGTVDTEANTVSVPISHLSTYVLMIHNRPAILVVENIILTPDEVSPGGAVTASIDIKNKGDLPGTYQANLMLDNAVMQTRTVTVDGGSSETIVFTIILDAFGEHQVSLGGLTSTFIVEKPLAAASFTMSQLRITPISVNIGEKVNVSVFIENNGDLAGTYPLTLFVDDLAVETREVVLEGSSSMTVSFSFTVGIMGEHTISIGDLEGVFEAASSSEISSIETAELELDEFSTTPNYDEITKTLKSVSIKYQMNQAWTSEPDARLIMTVFHDGELLEQVALFNVSHFTEDGMIGELNYVPATEWVTGEYIFQAELYKGEDLVQSTTGHSLVVTPEALTRVVSWWTLGVVIGIASVLIIVLLAVIVYRRRDMLRY
jgi:hypothetical protein